ncbi:hypothetical protein TALC_01253 [Thermoplasmatales archaeon BRNA1]|nr:hypothetical protein TALC_01253 [Thermoplasmatales archaeon BRNA1]
MTKGILIVGYGTRTGNLTDILESQAARLRARGRKNIYVSYFRISEPTIPDAIAKMAADGIDDVLAIPYYIAEGRMTLELIPEKLGIGHTSHGVADIGGRKVKVTVAPAFGRTRMLTNILTDRIAQAGGSKDTGILVIGHGSRDMHDSNREIVELNARRLGDMGYRHVAYGFNEFCGPEISDALASLAKETDEVIVTPLFIANGVHLGEEIAEKLGISNYSKGGKVDIGGKMICVKYMAPVEDDVRLLESIDAKVADFYGE